MTDNMKPFYAIYQTLYNLYGPQGWWPQTGYAGSNPTKRGATNGYHPKRYDFPQNIDQVFEVCLGSILTQNTNFIAVEKALINLVNLKALTPEAILALDYDNFKQAIRPAGYYNQKSRYIREFIPFFLKLNGGVPSREGLLSCVGIGPETADSILLYGYKQPQFKVDAYTTRIFHQLELIPENAKYDDIKVAVETELSNIVKGEKLVIIYQEFHALIVEHAKRFYSKKPYAEECPLPPNKKHSS
ncbi:uncharacterized endonuclease III related protein [Shewanella sediminis HAW-EB3]|uniref:Uncharacterized endonuclease III related protein n=1 Tax=Shewanella sediminis (strain HAW-EB3) TaxID=425104 RepID=A8FSU8_SHESH|nr:endonuclease III [Shewanella sediminis]ABV35921.1 uncharacterized endonuclease III related protein [Shewanella sediminis HAW-EB3]